MQVLLIKLRVSKLKRNSCSLFVDKDVLELSLSHKEPSLGLLESKKLIINTYQKDLNGKTIYRIDPIILEALKSNPNLLF